LTSEPPLHFSYRSSKQLSAYILQREVLSKGAGNIRMLTVWGKDYAEGIEEQ